MVMLGKSPFDDASGQGLLAFLKYYGIIPAGASGTFTANGATPVTVSAPSLVVGASIAITLKTVGGTVGAIPHVATITPGTGFTVVGTALDTSIYNWAIINPA